MRRDPRRWRSLPHRQRRLRADRADGATRRLASERHRHHHRVRSHGRASGTTIDRVFNRGSSYDRALAKETDDGDRFHAEPRARADPRLRVRDFIQNVVQAGRGEDRRPRQDRAQRLPAASCSDARRAPRPPASGCRTCRRSGAAWASATSSSRWCRPRRPSRTTARGCSTARRPTRATCTPSCTGRPTSRRRSTCARSATAASMSCFAMTEPEVAGSDPTLIQTRAVPRRRRLGRSTDTSGSSRTRARASFAILIARTEDNPERPQAANTGFIVDIPSEGWNARARGRDDARLDRPLRDPHREPARPGRRTCSAAAARVTASASTGSARPASRTACAGSPRPRPRST